MSDLKLTYKLEIVNAVLSATNNGNSTKSDSAKKNEGDTIVKIGRKAEDSDTIAGLGTPVITFVAFERKLNSPNSLTVDVQISSLLAKETVFNSVQEAFVNKKASFAVVRTSNNVDTKEEYTNLYIHHAIPLFKGSSSLYVRLKIYSYDYQLTLKQYSNSHIAKRLFTDIINNCNTNCSEDKNITIKKDELKHLCLDNNEEMILPYLVQYNESFYDFISRTANRCGEFLYFDKGELHFGFPKSPTTVSTELTASNCSNIFCKKLEHVDTLYFSRNEVNETFVPNNDGSDWDVNWEKEQTSEQKKAAKNAADELDKKKLDFYDFEINEEEHHTRVFSDKLSSIKQFTGHKGPFWSKMIASALTENSMYNIAKKLLATPIKLLMDARGKHTDMERTWKANLYEGLKKKATDQQKHGKGKEESITPFVAQAGVFTSQDYQKVREGELKASEQAVTFNMGSNMLDVQLGQILTYDKAKYIIVKILMKPSLSGSLFTSMDTDFPSDFNNMSGSEMQIVAIPYDENNVYPPMIPTGHVRHADPQVANVVSLGYYDPMMQGRVRVRFPWDKYDNISPWLRVIVPLAHSGGFYGEPSKGDEVLINYFGGNVERPYIAGYLRNKGRAFKFQKAPLYLMSKNGHSVSFSDPADPGLFFEGISPCLSTIRTFAKLFPDSKSDFFNGYDKSESDSQSDKNLLKMVGGITMSDSFGLYRISMSSDQRKIDISSPFGDVGINAFTGISISAPNGDISIKGKNVSIEAGNSVKIVSGNNINDGHSDLWREKGGFPKVLLSLTTDVLADYAKNLTNVIDLKLLRTVIEVILRPVSGTTQVKSYNYLLLEAGPGIAAVEKSRYRKKPAPAAQAQGGGQAAAQGLTKREKIDKIHHVINVIHDTTNKIYGSLTPEQKSNLTQARLQFQLLRHNCLTAQIVGNDCIDFNKIMENIWNDNTNLNADNIDNFQVTNESHIVKTNDLKKILQVEQANQQENNDAEGDNNEQPAQQVNNENEQVFNTLKSCIERIVKTAGKLILAYKGFKNEINLIYQGENLNVENNNAFIKLKDTFKNVYEERIFSDIEKNKGDITKFKIPAKEVFRRLVFAKFLEDAKGLNDIYIMGGKKLEQKEAKNWFEYIQAIKVKSKDDIKAGNPGALKGALNTLETAITKPWKDLAKGLKEEDVWDPSKPGRIIYAEDFDVSYYYDKNGERKWYYNGDENAVNGQVPNNQGNGVAEQEGANNGQGVMQTTLLDLSNL